MSLLRHYISKKHKMGKLEDEFIYHSMERLSLPTRQNKQLGQTVDRFFHELKLSSSSDTEGKKIWKVDRESMSVQMPEHFEQLMTDIALVYPLIRPRMDWTLLQVLAIARRKDQPSSPPSHHILEAPYWQFETTITGSDDPAMEASVDYILWYGARGDWDTNLVVVRSDSLMDGESWAALPSMSVVYAARKARKSEGDIKYKGGIYGICTDSYTWTFLHLSDKGRVSKRSLTWDDDKQEVIGQLHKIIRQAFDLHRAREQDLEARRRMIDEFFHCDENEESSDDDVYDWL